MPRLFSALEVPPIIAKQLASLRGGLPGARFIDVENYHITLRFYGDVENLLADSIVQGLDQIKCPRLNLEIAGIDVFGARKPHSLVAKIKPHPNLISLQAAIDYQALKRGIARDRKKFAPHITIARFNNVKKADLLSYLTQHSYFSCSAFQVSRFVLMSSRASLGGGPYIIEDHWPLFPY